MKEPKDSSELDLRWVKVLCSDRNGVRVAEMYMETFNALQREIKANRGSRLLGIELYFKN